MSLDERYAFSDPRSGSGMYGGSPSSPGRIHDLTERRLHGVAAAATTVTTVTTETAVIGLSRRRPT